MNNYFYFLYTNSLNMYPHKCQTEYEKVWLEDAKALFCSFSPIPLGSLDSGTRFNAVTRLIIYCTLICITLRLKHWYYVLLGGILLLVVVYIRMLKNKQEHFQILSNSYLKMDQPIQNMLNKSVNNSVLKTIVSDGNPQMLNNGKSLLYPNQSQGITIQQQAQLIDSKDAYNQLRLDPLRTANLSNSYTNYGANAINVNLPTTGKDANLPFYGEAGQRDPQAGIQYFTPKSGVNRKTMIPPIIGPRITDQDYWGKQSTVVQRTNQINMVDITNEYLNTSDMAQIPTRYPEGTQGYQVGYPLGIPVMTEQRNPGSVWDMNKVGENPDIGYYTSATNMYLNQNVRDYDQNVLPLYQKENSYIDPNLRKMYNEQPIAGINNDATPLYVPYKQPDLNPQPSVQYVGINQDVVNQQQNAVCRTCNVSSSSNDSKKEGFSFIDIDGGQAVQSNGNGKQIDFPPSQQRILPPPQQARMQVPPTVNGVYNQFPTYPMQREFNNMGGQGMFGGQYTMMNRVPPGQNYQIPAITSQLMPVSPVYSFTDQYFQQPNNKLFLNTLQPNLFSYVMDQTPINSSVGISYAPQLPPRVLDQVEANGVKYPLYSSIDPQFIRSDGTPGQQSQQPIRTDWSSNYSNFQAPQGSINFEDIYNPTFTSYGDPYRSYSDVNLGTVQYYYSDVDAYTMPNFISRTNIDYVDFRNPNGQIWPEYIRNTGLDDVRAHVENQTTADELMHREDLMSLQMQKADRISWQKRFAPLNNNNFFYGNSAGSGV